MHDIVLLNSSITWVPMVRELIECKTRFAVKAGVFFVLKYFKNCLAKYGAEIESLVIIFFSVC